MGGGCWGFPEDAEPALPLPRSSTGRSSVPRIAASPAGLRLGELSQQVLALTVAFPRDKEGGKILMWKEAVPGKQGLAWQSLPPKEPGTTTVFCSRNVRSQMNSPANLGLSVRFPTGPGENSSNLAKCSFLSFPCHFSCVLLVSSVPWVGPSVCPSIGGTCWRAAAFPWSACGFKVLPLIGFALTYGQSGFLPPLRRDRGSEPEHAPGGLATVGGDTPQPPAPRDRAPKPHRDRAALRHMLP